MIRNCRELKPKCNDILKHYGIFFKVEQISFTSKGKKKKKKKKEEKADRRHRTFISFKVSHHTKAISEIKIPNHH